MSRNSKRATALITALALGALGAFAAAPADAATGPNLDPSALGSLTIHKYAEPEIATDLPHDGTELDPADLTGLTALDGVTFSVQRVEGIDLTTNAGWETANGLTAAAVFADTATYPLGTASSEATVGGVASFADLALGVYLVTETDPGPNDIAFAPEPFLVSIPLPDSANGWIYDVHVYPKNSLTAIEKAVDDEGATGLGSTVFWPITVEIPQLAEGQQLTSFVISDELDARLTFNSATVALSPTDTLDSGDYTISPAAATPGAMVEVTFTATGLDKLEAAQGGNAVVTLDTTVTALGDGFIKNDALVTINDSEFTSNEVQTDWGALVILKHAGADETKVLSGARFQLFRTEADAAARTSAISVSGETTFTSGADGLAVIPGLKAGAYWLVETQAPIGYTASTTPLAVTVTAGDVTLTSIDYRVSNTQAPPYMLPLTGGNGALWFAVGGGAMIVLAAGAALVLFGRRRRAEVRTDV